MIILQATEILFSGKTWMPFYGFKRKGEGIPITVLKKLEEVKKKKIGPSEVYMLW